MTNSALVRGEVKVRRRHFLDRFFKFVSLGVNLYITCVIYRRALHAGPKAPLCFARISVRKYCQNIHDWTQVKSDLLKTLLADVL